MPLTYLKLKFNRRFQKRFVPHKTKILNYDVFYNDPRSLFTEYKTIFLNKIYHFESQSQTPVIIDGGGHIGISTLYFKHTYPGAKVLIFEPDPMALKFLKKNIHGNKLSSVKIIESGLFSEEGKLNFSKDGTDGGRVTKEGSQNIRVEKLSKYIDAGIDFLKLNIEGPELEVMQDLDNSNKLDRIREMCIEWHSFSNEKQNLGRLLQILEKNDYKYLINHFDYKINSVLKPPFRVKNKTQYYLLIYAKKRNLLD